MADDVHNPFGGGVDAPKKKRRPDVFDPDHKGDANDPFKSPLDDEKWDEVDEPPSTRDI